MSHRQRFLVVMGLLFVALLLPVVIIAQGSSTPEPDSAETLLEQQMARQAEQERGPLPPPDMTFSPFAVHYPLLVGVDNVTVPAYQVDPLTNGFLPAFSGFQLWGAAFDALNNLVYFNNGANLYQWPVGGAATLLGTMVDSMGNGQSMVGLAFHNGVLYGTKNIANEAVYIIDPVTLVASVYIDYVDADYDFGGLAADPRTGQLYGTNDDATPHGTGLFRINANGTATFIAPYPAGQTDIDGLAISHEGRAYLVTDEPGFIYVYDLVASDYTTPLNNPWTNAEVFSSGAWIWEQPPSVCNRFPLAIPSLGTSGVGRPYPSTINVTGFTSTIADVNVHLFGLSHTWPDDIDMMLVGPQGQRLIIMSDAGGNNAITNLNLTFDDAAPGPLPDDTPIDSGVYRPTNYGLGDTFPLPAPAPSAATTLATFNNTDPNGRWTLYVVDDSGGDAGQIALGWCLEITVHPPVIAVDPTALSQTQPFDSQRTQALTISNASVAELTWTIAESAAAAAADAPPAFHPEEPAPTASTLESHASEGAPPLPDAAAAAAATAVSLIGPSGDGLIYYNDRTTFDAAFPGLPVEDFEAGLWADGNTLGCPAPFNTFTNNNCFAPGGILPGVSFQDNPLNAAGGGSASGLAGVGAGALGAISKNIATNTAADSFEILFSPPVRAAGLDLIHYFTHGAVVNITLYDASNGLIGATEAIANNSGIFWGVYSVTPIGRINIVSASGFEGVDNVAFGEISACTPAADIPWLVVNPVSGAISGSGAVDLEVTFDSAGLAVGVYTGTLCLHNNDPLRPLLEVPLTLTVTPHLLYLPTVLKP